MVNTNRELYLALEGEAYPMVGDEVAPTRAGVPAHEEMLSLDPEKQQCLAAGNILFEYDSVEEKYRISGINHNTGGLQCNFISMRELIVILSNYPGYLANSISIHYGDKDCDGIYSEQAKAIFTKDEFLSLAKDILKAGIISASVMQPHTVKEIVRPPLMSRLTPSKRLRDDAATGGVTQPLFFGGSFSRTRIVRAHRPDVLTADVHKQVNRSLF